MSVTISAKQLYEQHQAGKPVDLIDVRTPAEFQEIHCTLAKLVPLDRLDPKAIQAARSGSAQEPIYLVCKSGTRAQMAAKKFQDAGIDVICIDGGMTAWEQAGLPVVRGKKAVSLERQVRIAAGALVLLGAALGAFVDPWFIGLSAFVGAGLLFAGITDSCAMGMLLARMPWNQASTTCCTK